MRIGWSLFGNISLMLEEPILLVLNITNNYKRKIFLLIFASGLSLKQAFLSPFSFPDCFVDPGMSRGRPRK